MAQKHTHCPQCGECLSPVEIEEQFCRKCDRSFTGTDDSANEQKQEAQTEEFDDDFYLGEICY